MTVSIFINFSHLPNHLSKYKQFTAVPQRVNDVEMMLMWPKGVASTL